MLSAENFFKNNAKTDKIFSHVSIKRDKTISMAYRRVRKTMHVDIPLLTVCIRTNIQKNHFSNTRVTVNNGVAFAQRDYKLEEFLNKTAIHKRIAQEALDHLDTNIYDKRSDDYKSHMFRVSLKSAIEELTNSKDKK